MSDLIMSDKFAEVYMCRNGISTQVREVNHFTNWLFIYIKIEIRAQNVSAACCWSHASTCYTFSSHIQFYCFELWTADANECTEDTDMCHLHATCCNTIGSYTCSCNTEYTGNGYYCTSNCMFFYFFFIFNFMYSLAAGLQLLLLHACMWALNKQKSGTGEVCPINQLIVWLREELVGSPKSDMHMWLL